MKRIMLGILVLFLLVCSNAESTIWIRNGNFFMRFYDINEGNNFEFVRYYNSVGYDKGLFGYGWGTTLGPKLYSINGMVTIEELSGGGRSRFIDKKKDTISSVVDRAVKSARIEGQSADYSVKLKKALLQDLDSLFDFTQKHGLFGYVPKEGTVLDCVERVGERIKKIKGGYIREKVDGTLDHFDDSGRILRQKMKSGRSLVYAYNQKGQLDSIKDQLGRWMKFYFADKGLLQKIVLFNNKITEYKYDDKGDLVEARDSAGNVYSYKYNNYHKLIEATMPPVSKGGAYRRIVVRYEGNTGRAVYQKTEDGWETYLEFSSDKDKNQNYESVSVIKRFGKEAFSEKYEYWKRPRADGSFYDYKIRETASTGRQKTTVYTMCCATPLVIDDNGKITRFEYNTKGMLSKKVFPEGRIIEVKYDDKDRVASVINNGVLYKFGYNDLSQLSYAGTKNLAFNMEYDGNGNLYKISDNKGYRFDIKYDQKGRISELVSKYGSLLFNYSYASDEPEIVAKGSVAEKAWEIRRVYQDYIDTIMVYSLIDLI